jgi:gamma-glutamylcyclotransferase (GGCT)/AIG2-like uncharacterized protein YtfP
MPVTKPNAMLFSYGSLQKKDIQVATFGRELKGREDAMTGYERRVSAVTDPRIAALIRETYYATVQPSANPKDTVAGIVFEITGEELHAADKYETAAGYHRVSVMLASGNQAWVYIRG